MTCTSLKAFTFEIYDVEDLRKTADVDFGTVADSIWNERLKPHELLHILTKGMGGNSPYVWMAAKSQLTTPKFASHPYDGLAKIYGHMPALTRSFWKLVSALHLCEPEDLRKTWETEIHEFLEFYTETPEFQIYTEMLSI